MEAPKSVSITDFDENFRFLQSEEQNMQKVPEDQLIIKMTRFKKGLSFRWLLTISQDKREESLIAVFKTILHYTEHSSAQVRVNTYCTLGAILLCVAPFSAQMIINSFKKAIVDFEISPKASVAIINIFIYLTRFISPVRVSEFVVNVPILHHFSIDFSEFVNYLPPVIPKMANLPVEFYRNLLRSIIFSSGKKPNLEFSNAVSLIVALNKKTLMADLIDYLKNNDLQTAALWLGPHLFTDFETFSYLGKDGASFFLTSIENEFKEENPFPGLFDNACKTAYYFLKYTKGKENESEISQRIYSSLRNDYKPDLMVRKYSLPSKLPDLIDNPSDKDMVRRIKVNALATYYCDNVDTAEPDAVASAFISYSNSSNDLYCTFIESFTKCVNQLSRRCSSETAITIIKSILSKSDQNWVISKAICQLIDNIPIDIVSRKFPTFSEISIIRLLEYQLSSNDKLSDAALCSLSSISSRANIGIMLQYIIRSNWLDEACCIHRFMLLSKLSDQLESPSFSYFIGIAYESLWMFSSNDALCSSIFSTLSHIPVPKVDHSVVLQAFSLISIQYQAFAGKPLELPVNPATILSPTSLIDTVDTDIVGNMTFDHKKVMELTFNAFNFLLNVKGQLNDIEMKSLFKCSLYLVPIFDKDAINAANSLCGVNQDYNSQLFKYSMSIFNSTSDDEVAASCCNVFVSSKGKLPPPVQKMIREYLNVQRYVDPELLFLCFIIFDQDDHEQAIKIVTDLLKRMKPKDSIVFAFKLTQVIGKRILESITKEIGLAAIQYAVEFGREYSNTVLEYSKIEDFSNWPLNDDRLRECIVTFFGKLDSRIPLKNMESLDIDHWQFVISHQRLFETDKVADFIRERPHFFAKVNTDCFFKETPNSFSVSKVNIEFLPSATPYLRKGAIPNSISLLKYFFRTSDTWISGEVFRKAYDFCLNSKDEEIIKECLNYGIKHSIYIDASLLLSRETSDSLFSLAIVHCSHGKTIKTLTDDLRTAIEARIGAPISSDLIFDQSPIAQRVVLIEPSFFMESLLNSEGFKAHKILSILPNIAIYPSQKLYEVLNCILARFNELESTRKRAAILRYASAAIQSMALKRDQSSLSSSVSVIIEEIPEITSRLTSPLFTELSILISTILPQTSEYYNLQNFFEGISSVLSLSSLYAPAMTKVSSNDRPSDFLMTLLKSNLPSQNFSSLCSLQLYLKPSSGIVISTFSKQMILEVIKQCPRLASNFRTIPCSLRFFQRVLSNGPNDQIVSSIWNNFLCDNRTPQFIETLQIMSKLPPRQSGIDTALLNIGCVDSNVVNCISDCYNQLCNRKRGTEALRDFLLESLEQFRSLFHIYPSIEVGRLVLRVITDMNEDSGSLFAIFNNLFQENKKFYISFVIMALFLRDAKPSQRLECQQIFEGMKMHFEFESQTKSLALLVKDCQSDLTMAVTLAASNTNECESIEKFWA